MPKQRTVTKTDLVDSVADATGLPKKAVKEVVDTLLRQLGKRLDSGARVQFTGFGTFEVRRRKARSGVKPGTTEKIMIPASKYAAFRPAKSLKRAAAAPEGDPVTEYTIPKPRRTPKKS